MVKINQLNLPQKIKVLIVDDARLITDRLTQIVKEIDIVAEVFVSNEYHQALVLIEKHAPQIILLDIFLNNDNGLELLSHVNASYPNIKVIMVSNKASVYYRNLCKKLGATGFIDKSDEFEKLPEMIASYY